MPEVQTDHSETAELSKPQLRMVDLGDAANLLI